MLKCLNFESTKLATTVMSAHSSKTYPAIAVANRFLDLARASNRGLTPMQLLKLVYIAHGWKLAVSGQSLISEDVEAWKHGPVIRPLYNKVKRFGYDHVSENLKSGIFNECPDIDADDQLAARIINAVYKGYGKKSGTDLSQITHLPDTPWDRHYVPGENRIISTDSIREHYQDLLAQIASDKEEAVIS